MECRHHSGIYIRPLSGFWKNNKAVHHLPIDHSEYITLGMYVFVGLYQKSYPQFSTALVE